MDEFLKNMYGSNNNNNNNKTNLTSSTGQQQQQRLICPSRSIGAISDSSSRGVIVHPSANNEQAWRETELTLEDYLTKASNRGGVRGRGGGSRGGGGDDDVRLTVGVPPPLSLSSGHHRRFEVTAGSMISGGQYRHGQFSLDGFGGLGIGGSPMGRVKRRIVTDESVMDKATQQKQRRMIKNRESAARSRERKQARTTELEALVAQLQVENDELVKEEGEQKKERLKKLMENVIPVVEKRRPRKALRRVMSSGW